MRLLRVLAIVASCLPLLIACDRRCDELRAAVAAGDHAAFERLAARDGDLACVDGDDWTLLHVAARRGRGDLVTALLARGAALEARGDVGRTPLYEAAEYGQLETVRLLIERGARVDAASDQGFTPLMVAAEKNHPAIVEELLDRGANPRATNAFGKTALHQYLDHAQSDELAIPRLLVERGVPLEVHDVIGETVLHTAARHRAAAVARFLLDAGANPNATKRGGHTPLDIARSNGFEEIAVLVADRGGRAGGRAVYDGATRRALPAGVTRGGTVVRASGPGAVPVGTRCMVTARPAEGSRFNCQIEATCGGRRLSGGASVGYTFCEAIAGGVRAFDPFGTPDDDDPSVELDTGAQRFVADDGMMGSEGTSVELRLDPSG